MNNNTHFPRSGQERPQVKPTKPLDIYEKVTQVIIEKLEQGRMPWRADWSTYGLSPANYVSKRSYTGINRILLGCEDYEHNYFLTIHQVNQLGGRIKKGSKGHIVVFAKTIEVTELSETGATDTRYQGMLRYYHVFNVSAVEGVNFKYPEVVTNQHEPDEYAEVLIHGLRNPPKYSFGNGTPCYIPSMDALKMPKPEYFNSSEAYYGTFFHELIHATGHPSRLNRPELTAPVSFGSRTYSQEELTAEIGACYLCNLCGHDVRNNELLDNSANYIAGWLSRLRNDRRFIFEAAAKAQKAVDFILNNR